MTERPEVEQPLVSEKDLTLWAQQDAGNDNAKGAVGEFPAFDGRVQHITQTYTATITTNFINDFQLRFSGFTNEFADITKHLVIDPSAYIQQVEVDVNGSVAKADQHDVPRISDLHKDFMDWQARFRSGLFNGISNPKRQNHVWHWGLILFLFAVEVMLNSRFFAETSEYGLLGGTMAAVTISVVNVGLPILVGFFTHMLYFNKRMFQSVIGITLIIGFALFVWAFNFEVAEYRDRLLVAAGKAPSPLPEYFALLSIGCAIAVISFWKMFSFMDPFLKPRRCQQNKQMVIERYQEAALKPIKDTQKQVNDALDCIANIVYRSTKEIEQQRANFKFRCAKAIKDSNASIAYYHSKYCPPHADPDPEIPDLGHGEYDFSLAHDLVNDTIDSLERDCKKAVDEWQPLLKQVKQGLADTHKRFQAVVVATIGSAIARATQS